METRGCEPWSPPLRLQVTSDANHGSSPVETVVLPRLGQFVVPSFLSAMKSHIVKAEVDTIARAEDKTDQIANTPHTKAEQADA